MFFSFRRISPNPIDSLQIPQVPGKLGLVACPGVRIKGGALSGRALSKAIEKDIAAMVDWGACGVLTLVEEHELSIAGVSDLSDRLEHAGLWWRHMPIMDMYIPEPEFEQQWQTEGLRLRQLLQQGENIIVHCYAGLGRTGVIAARLLVEFGMQPEPAIDAVRVTNKRRIQTREQAEYIRALGGIPT